MNWHAIRGLPAPLIVLFGLALFLPFCSLFFFHPEQLKGSLFLLSLAAGVYWLIPFSLALAISKRSILLIPLFYAQCAGLLAHATLGLGGYPEQMQLVQFLLLTLMTYYSFTLLRRDMVFPLLSARVRAWRTSPRIEVPVPVALWFFEGDTKTACRLADISLGGFSVIGPAGELTAFLREKELLSHFVMNLGLGNQQWMLNVKLVHSQQDSGCLRAGFKVLNSSIMHEVIARVSGDREQGFQPRLLQYWARLGFRQAAFLSWTLAVFVLLSVPSCIRKSGIQYERVESLSRSMAPPLLDLGRHPRQ